MAFLRYLRTRVFRADVDDEEKSDEGRGIKFPLNANPREQQVQEKRRRSCGKSCRMGDAGLGECSASAARSPKKDEKRAGEKSKWMGKAVNKGERGALRKRKGDSKYVI